MCQRHNLLAGGGALHSWRLLLTSILSTNWLQSILNTPKNFANEGGCLEKKETAKSRIGMGMGTGTVTRTRVMWRGTYTRTVTSFTSIYFNSNLIYTKNKKSTCSLGWCPAPDLSLYIEYYYIYVYRDLNKLLQWEGQKVASFQSQAIVLHAYCAFCQFLHCLCTTTCTMWNDRILSSLENVNDKVTNFTVSVWARTCRSSLFSFSFISQPLKAGQFGINEK